MIKTPSNRRFPGCPLTFAFAAIFALATPTANAAPVKGEVTEYTLDNGINEQCIAVSPLPGVDIDKGDRRDEQEYCAIDFRRVALCPKLWSTSPGTVIYELETTDAAAIRQFERAECANGHHARDLAKGKPAVLKMSVNGRDTSATYAPSSWVYYHFSRYLDAGVFVPVAVYRSTDLAAHHERVVRPGLQASASRHGAKMLAAGWRYMEALESGDASSASTAAAITDQGRQVYGVLVDNKGDRYGPEFNGTRESGWGDGQNYDFQQTAGYLALRDGQAVREAAVGAVHEARKNPKMAGKLSADTSAAQVIFWMNDLLEITLLDYVLGQQDRIGNIDYRWRWYWLEDGKVKSDPAHDHTPPAEIAGHSPVRLRQSAINDNDAGVRRGYSNFAKRTGMLDGLRHYNPGLYARLGRLAADAANQGPVWQWMTGTAGLSEKEADAITTRLGEAWALLKADCDSGRLKLDLDRRMALDAQHEPAGGACDAGL